MNAVILIAGSICLYLLFYHPGWILLAGGILVVGYLLKQYDKEPAVSKDREEDLSRQKLYTDIEGRADKKAEKRMKPDFRADPEWQRLSKKLQNQVDRAQKKEEHAERLKELTDEII